MSGSAQAAESILRRLEWTVLRRLDGVLHGDYLSFFRGFGLDLADLREYQYHDDVRHIDWNVTARLQIPHVREYNEDREISAWFLVDRSRSIEFGSGPAAKRGIALDFVAVMARLLSGQGNRVGAILFDRGIETVLPPRSGRRQVLQLIERLRATPVSAPAGTTDLQRFLTPARQIIRRRSLLFLVSDFITPPGWGAALAALAARHEVLAVRLTDPLEAAIPDLGMVRIEDAETGEQVLVDTRSARFRQRFAEAAARRDAELRSTLQRAGVDALELSSGEDLVPALTRFASLRRRRARLGAGLSADALRR